jgi:large subunit ribosomal protein L21
MTFAIVRAGGKQLRVEPGQVVDVEKIAAEPGDRVELNDVLLIGGDGEPTYGKPLVDGARVVAEVVECRKGPKVIVFKYKPKTRYRKKTGHRQALTRLSIQEIVGA